MIDTDGYNFACAPHSQNGIYTPINRPDDIFSRQSRSLTAQPRFRTAYTLYLSHYNTIIQRLRILAIATFLSLMVTK